MTRLTYLGGASLPLTQGCGGILPPDKIVHYCGLCWWGGAIVSLSYIEMHKCSYYSDRFLHIGT